jgi:hypothetical protein
MRLMSIWKWGLGWQYLLAFSKRGLHGDLVKSSMQLAAEVDRVEDGC